MAYNRYGKLRAKRSKVKRGKPSKARRAAPRASNPHEPVVLTPLGKWLAEDKRLAEWRARVEAAPTMHGDAWKQGQLRHIDTLIANHNANKPESV